MLRRRSAPTTLLVSLALANHLRSHYLDHVLIDDSLQIAKSKGLSDLPSQLHFDFTVTADESF
jgi:hypothetical protein